MITWSWSGCLSIHLAMRSSASVLGLRNTVAFVFVLTKSTKSSYTSQNTSFSSFSFSVMASAISLRFLLYGAYMSLRNDLPSKQNTTCVPPKSCHAFLIEFIMMCMAMPTFSEVSPLITCRALKKVFAVSTRMCAMLIPRILCQMVLEVLILLVSRSQFLFFQ